MTYNDLVFSVSIVLFYMATFCVVLFCVCVLSLGWSC